MTNREDRWLKLNEVRKRMMIHGLIRSSVPTEHTISFPLPTRRWGDPTYACFASPALRHPGQPLQQGVPDRWWAVDAHNSDIIIYALWKVFPFTTDTHDIRWTTLTLPVESRSVAEQQQDIATIELLIDTLAPDFFTREAGDARTRKALAEALAVHLPTPVQPWYRALVPDFFAWLEQ